MIKGMEYKGEVLDPVEALFMQLPSDACPCMQFADSTGIYIMLSCMSYIDVMAEGRKFPPPKNKQTKNTSNP